MNRMEYGGVMALFKHRPGSAPIPARRPWYRLHCSTWLIVLLGLAAAVLIVVPGGIGRYPDEPSWVPASDWTSDTKEHDSAIVHGWPLPFLWRTPASWMGDPATISTSLPWKLTDSVRGFRVWPLFADLAIAGLLLTLFTVLVEWRRRRRRVFQFSLREILVVAPLMAVCLGWWWHERAADQKTKEHVAKLGLGYAFVLAPRLPLWLRTLAGDEKLSWTGFNGPANFPTIWWGWQGSAGSKEIQYLVEQFPAEVGIEIGEGDDVSAVASIKRLERVDVGWGANLARILTALKGNTHVREMRIAINDRPMGPEQVSLIATMPRLDSLSVLEPVRPKSQAWVAELPRCRSLKYLRLGYIVLGKDALNALGCMKQLRCLRLDSSEFSSDADLHALCGLEALDELRLSATNLNDSGALRLLDLPNLRRLRIDRTKLTSAVIVRLLDPSASRFAPGLEQICFDADAINDDVIAALKKLPRLHSIVLTWAPLVGPAAGYPKYTRIVSDRQRALPDRNVSANPIDGQSPG
jgi:hypothetical protein